MTDSGTILVEGKELRLYKEIAVAFPDLSFLMNSDGVIIRAIWGNGSKFCMTKESIVGGTYKIFRSTNENKEETEILTEKNINDIEANDQILSDKIFTGLRIALGGQIHNTEVKMCNSIYQARFVFINSEYNLVLMTLRDISYEKALASKLKKLGQQNELEYLDTVDGYL